MHIRSFFYTARWFVAQNNGRLFALSLAFVSFLFSGYNQGVYEHTLANKPEDQYMAIWKTPLAVITPALSFTPGLPRAKISFEQFRREAADKPYQVFYWQGWNTGQAHYYLREGNEWAVTYHVKVPGPQGDTYYVAETAIINRGEVSNWDTKTEYDPINYRFVSVVTSPLYFNLGWSWSWYLAAWAIILSVVANIGLEIYKKQRARLAQ